MKRIIFPVLALLGLLVLPTPASATTGSSCNNDPCTNLPYSYTVTVDGMVVPNMDDNVFGVYRVDAGSPVLPVTPETYTTNSDGTVTGTVTADVIVGLGVSQPLGNDVTVYFEGGIPQNGHGCDSVCPIASYPCTLSAGQTSTSCEVSDWWQSYWSGAPDVGGFDYNIIYTDPGQPNLVDLNGHPNSYGWGFTIIPAFVPQPPPGGALASSPTSSSGASFRIHYHPIFGGNFTLFAKRSGSVVYQRLLGWKSPGQHTAWFDCGTRRGQLALVVVGKRHGQTQQSQVKRAYC